jgi:hypothetical protein
MTNMEKVKLVEYNYGDMSIKKVQNGWMLIEGARHDENAVQFFVYESEEKRYLENVNATLGDAESLVRLLQDAFEGYLQCKKYGGIKITFHEKGYEDEENNNEI